MAVDRGGRSDVRQRRAFQKLSDNPFGSLGVIVGSGLVWDPATSTLAVELAANSGLEFTGASPADKLRIDLNTNVLTLTAGGLTMPLIASTDGVNNLTITVPTLNFAYTNTTFTGTGSFNVTGTSVSYVMSAGFLVTADGGWTLDTLDAGFLNADNIVGISSGGEVYLTVGPDKVDISGGSSISVYAGSVATQLYLLTKGGAIFVGTGVSSVTDPQNGLLIDSATGVVNLRGMSTTVPVTVVGVSLGGTGGPALVVGGSPASGVNSNAGLSELRGGKPRGTGTSTVKVAVTDNAGTVQQRIDGNLTGLGFFGATPIARPGTYTITAAPAVATALNCNPPTYTGVGNASVTDLNDLGTKVNNLAGVVRQLIKHLGDTAGLGLVDETGY